MSAIGQVLNPPATGSLPSGYVRLTCGDPSFVLVALLGEEAPQLTAGVGGWTVVSRPREVGMTVWEGVEPHQLTLPLMLDGDHTYSQEPALRGLLRVSRGDRESPPGVVSLEGLPSLPADDWVIESIEYGDPIRRVSDMHRVRQAITLTLHPNTSRGRR
jgi:hypothetical protein